MAYNPEFSKMYSSTKTCKEIKYKKSLIISRDFFEGLNKIFAEQFDNNYKVKYICQLRNSCIEKYNSYFDLIVCDNILEKGIERLEIRAVSIKDKQFNFHIVVGIDPNSFVARYTVRGKINSDLGHIDAFMKAVDDELRKISRSQFYTIISKTEIIPMFFLTTLFSFLYYHFLGLLTFQNISPLWNTIVSCVLVGSMGLSVSSFLLFPIKKLFPRIVFQFGYGISNEKNKSGLRERVLWDIIVALLIGIVGAFLYDWLSGNI